MQVAPETMSRAAAAAHCGPQWDALIRDPERIRTISPREVMPLFQGMMRGGCKICPNEQVRTCQNLERHYLTLGHDAVEKTFSMPWDFKAEDVFAGGASDASIRHEDLAKVAGAVEATARRNGNESVTLADLTEGLMTLARDLSYRDPGVVEPAFEEAVATMGDRTRVVARGRAASKERAAAFRADPAASARNAESVKAGLPHEARVHDMLAQRELNWCKHVPHLFTRMLTRVPLDDAQLDALFSFAEGVARERGHSGVTPRDVDTALMRAAVTGLSGCCC